MLFPGVFLPLHIFEERYRALTRDALAGDRIIGMTLLRPGFEGDYDGRPPIYPVGCAGVISHSDRLPDGRYNIVLHGLSKFRIVEEMTDGEYRRARIEPLTEITDAPGRREIKDLRTRIEGLLLSALKATEVQIPGSLSDEDLDPRALPVPAVRAGRAAGAARVRRHRRARPRADGIPRDAGAAGATPHRAAPGRPLMADDATTSAPREWNAPTYHRVSSPQFTWGQAVLDRLPLRGDETVLDVGCGTGRLTELLAGRLPHGRAIGIDQSANMLATARTAMRASVRGRDHVRPGGRRGAADRRPRRRHLQHGDVPLGARSRRGCSAACSPR